MNIARAAAAIAGILGLSLCAGAAGALTACDKLGLTKKDSEGGVAERGGGGGVLSFLGGTFEGEVTMKVSGGSSAAGVGAKAGSPQTLVFGMKSPRVRVDGIGGAAAGDPMLAEGAAFIIDPPVKKGFILMPSRKMAMVIDFDKAKAPGAPGTAPPKIDKTGKKSVIAGYECEEWKISSKDSRADVCVAEGIKWIDLGDIGMSSPELALAVAAGESNRFPLRLVAFDAKGTETSRMEATKIEKKKLADDRFAVPADYKVIDMDALMGGLGGMAQPGAVPGQGKAPPGLPPGFVMPQPPQPPPPAGKAR